MNTNALTLQLGDKSLKLWHKKTGLVPGFHLSMPNQHGSASDVGQRVVHRLRALQLAQGLADHLFGEAGAFPALGADTGAIAHLTVAAATFVDRFADLGIGDTLAEADVHSGYYWLLGCG